MLGGINLGSRFTCPMRLLVKPTLAVGFTGLVAALVLVVRSLVIYAYQVPRLGFSEFEAPDGVYYRAKTMWDWLELLIVPVALTGASLLFSVVRARAEQALKDDRHREQALVRCFDLVTELAAKEFSVEGEPNNFLNAMVRANVLATLHALDPARKGRLILFLYSLNLLGCPVSDPMVTLQNGDLGCSALAGAKLPRICLEGTDLSRADLQNADLCDAHFDHAVLVRARLVGADLSGASLAGANLTNADLRKANIENTSFEGAILKGIRASDYQKEKIRRGSAI